MWSFSSLTWLQIATAEVCWSIVTYTVEVYISTVWLATWRVESKDFPQLFCKLVSPSGTSCAWNGPNGRTIRVYIRICCSYKYQCSWKIGTCKLYWHRLKLMPVQCWHNRLLLMWSIIRRAGYCALKHNMHVPTGKLCAVTTLRL